MTPTYQSRKTLLPTMKIPSNSVVIIHGSPPSYRSTSAVLDPPVTRTSKSSLALQLRVDLAFHPARTRGEQNFEDFDLTD